MDYDVFHAVIGWIFMNPLLETPAQTERRPLRFRKPGAWGIITVLLALLLLTPVAVVVASVFMPSGDVWQHLAATVLPLYLGNTLLLLLGVGFGVLLLGVTSAWLVTMCRFPLRRVFEWALLLPMAVPAYILAYTYTDFLQFSGPVQTALRNATGWGFRDYWFPNVRSLGGAIIMLSLALYPYVYLLARAAFLEQSVAMLEAARSLGQGPWRSFMRVALPLARAGIVAGLALALMETISDFGTVEYFGVSTLTTGIYRTWFGMGERIAAAQLAAVLLGFILLLVMLERFSRRASHVQPSSSRFKSLPGYRLKGVRAWGVAALLALPIIAGFLLPAGILLDMTISYSELALNPRVLVYARNSLVVSALTGALAVGLALVLAYGRRLQPTRLVRSATRVATLGYAIPGSVIAVGVLMHLGWLDNAVDAWFREVFGISTGLLLSGTIAGLVFAYLVRFLAVAFGAVESGLGKVTASMDNAARSLGRRSLTTLFRIHIPLLRGSLLTALLLVFVDVIKELPATLIVRPFNFDTLAVRVYRLAADERLHEAAGGALLIVLVGILPVILLSLAIARSREQQR
jgi:iron(III) transport system permease protein